MDISLRIKELRTKLNKSQNEFASLIGIDNSQLSKIERGIILPTLSQIMEISSIFNVTTDWLILGKEDENKYIKETNSTYERFDPGYEAFLKYLEKENTITLIEKLLSERKNDKK